MLVRRRGRFWWKTPTLNHPRSSVLARVELNVGPFRSPSAETPTDRRRLDVQGRKSPSEGAALDVSTLG